MYRIVLLNGGLAEYEAVLQEYRNTEDNQVGAHSHNAAVLYRCIMHLTYILHPCIQIRKYPMYTLGASRDRALKQRTLDWAVKSGEVKLQDTFYPIGSVAHGVEGQALAWAYFQEVSTDSTIPVI